MRLGVSFGDGQIDGLVVGLGDHDVDVDQRGQGERRGEPRHDDPEDEKCGVACCVGLKDKAREEFVSLQFVPCFIYGRSSTG